MVPELPEGWRREPLSELGSFLKGKGGPRADDEPVGVPVVRYGQLYTRHHDVIRDFYSFVSPDRAKAYTRLRSGDLVLAGSGETSEEIGKAAAFLGPEPAYAAGDTVIFRPNGSLDPLFLGYAFNGSEAVGYKASVGQGGSVVHIYVRDLERFCLSVPPLVEQKKIAAIISSVDEAIAAARKVIEQTQRVKQGLLQTLMNRGIGHTRFKKTEIGEIPEEWEVRRVDSIATVVSGATPSRAEAAYFDQGEIPWVKTLDLQGSWISETDETITAKALHETSCKLLPKGAVLCAMYGGFKQIGRTGVLAVPATTNQAISAMILHGGEAILPAFLNYFLVAHRPRWRRIAASSRKDPNITRQDVCGFRLAVPDIREQSAIVERVDEAAAALEAAEAETERLLGIKQGLLQDLLTGRVRVPLD